MKVIGLLKIEQFLHKHSDCKQQLFAWVSEAKGALWLTPSDVKLRYVNASILPENRVVFNIKGNKYRLDTKVNYQKGIVLIMRIGTHAEYDEWRF